VSERADTVVIGAGSTGTAAAWQLARLGAGRILLLESGAVGTGTTGRSCAILRMHYMHEPLARMALHSRRVYESFDELVGGRRSFRAVGWMFLARPEDAEPLAANVAMQQGVGVETCLLDPVEAAELVPGMQVADVGAVAWEAGSGYTDPRSSAEGFLGAATRLGAQYRPGVEVHRLEPRRGGWRVETGSGPVDAGTVLVAAGLRTVDLVRPLGVTLPVEPVRHTVAVLDRPPDFGPEHPVISDRVVGSYYRPEAGGRTLVGATGAYEGVIDPETDLDRPAPRDVVATFTGRFAQRFPAVTETVVADSYTSIYDCTPDLQPLLGPLPGIDNLHVAVGFSGHGFKLAPALGELLAEKIVGGRTSLVDIDLFRPSRFEEGATFVAPHPYSVPTLG